MRKFVTVQIPFFIEYQGEAIERCSLCDESEAVTLMTANCQGTLWLVDHGVVVSNPPINTKSLLNHTHFQQLEVQSKIRNFSKTHGVEQFIPFPENNITF